MQKNRNHEKTYYHKTCIDIKDRDKQIWTCNNCEESFVTSIELLTHIANKHSNEDGEETQTSSTPSNDHESRFVFSESMLDEFVDKNFLNGL